MDTGDRAPPEMRRHHLLDAHFKQHFAFGPHLILHARNGTHFEARHTSFNFCKASKATQGRGSCMGPVLGVRVWRSPIRLADGGTFETGDGSRSWHRGERWGHMGWPTPRPTTPMGDGLARLRFVGDLSDGNWTRMAPAARLLWAHVLGRPYVIPERVSGREWCK